MSDLNSKEEFLAQNIQSFLQDIQDQEYLSIESMTQKRMKLDESVPNQNSQVIDKFNPDSSEILEGYLCDTSCAVPHQPNLLRAWGQFRSMVSNASHSKQINQKACCDSFEQENVNHSNMTIDTEHHNNFLKFPDQAHLSSMKHDQLLLTDEHNMSSAYLKQKHQEFQFRIEKVIASHNSRSLCRDLEYVSQVVQRIFMSDHDQIEKILQLLQGLQNQMCIHKDSLTFFKFLDQTSSLIIEKLNFMNLKQPFKDQEKALFYGMISTLYFLRIFALQKLPIQKSTLSTLNSIPDQSTHANRLKKMKEKIEFHDKKLQKLIAFSNKKRIKNTYINELCLRHQGFTNECLTGTTTDRLLVLDLLIIAMNDLYVKIYY
eukprot:403360444